MTKKAKKRSTLPKLQWKMTINISGDKENQAHYRNEEYGISLGIFTPRINEFEFGRAKQYFKVDGNKRTFRSIKSALKVAANKERMAKRQWKNGNPITPPKWTDGFILSVMKK